MAAKWGRQLQVCGWLAAVSIAVGGLVACGGGGQGAEAAVSGGGGSGGTSASGDVRAVAGNDGKDGKSNADVPPPEITEDFWVTYTRHPRLPTDPPELDQVILTHWQN